MGVTVEYYPAIKYNDIKKFAGKMDETRKDQTEYGNPCLERQVWCVLT